MNRLRLCRTAFSSPLRIAEDFARRKRGPFRSDICPGKKDLPRGWDRDLENDLRAIRDWGASTVVTLIEAHEFELLKVSLLGERVQEFGMRWIHLPIATWIFRPEIRNGMENRRARNPTIVSMRERIFSSIAEVGIGRSGLVRACSC